MSGFEIAPPDERTLSLGQYLFGAAELALVVAAFGFAAWRLRARLLAEWTGAPARLAEAVLAIAGLVVAAEALGSVGAFTELGVLGAAAAVAIGGLALGRRRGAGTALPAPEVPPAAKLVVALACAAVAAAWMVPTLGSLAAGMDRADSLWYHGPLSARFVQTGSLGEIFHFDPIFFAAYYPANSEVLHAVPILAFGRDIASPVLNLGFLALGLLAAWCIGRPYGVAPAALVGGAVALGAQNLVEFQAGEALNDIVGVAFVMAAVAVLVNGFAAGRAGGGHPPSQPLRPPASHVPRIRAAGLLGRTPAASPPRAGVAVPIAAIAVAGLAAGLAVGTKLSFVAPVAALTVGVVAIAPRGARLRAAAAWSLPALVAGGYWYVRNLVAVGNPVPLLSFGPLGLPAPERDFELRPGYSVAHYFDRTDVWRDWFVPGLEESFGVLWPVTLVAMLAAGAIALARRREPVLRVLGAMVLITAIAYVFTPLTAGGEEGEPIAFVWNVRYLAPAAAVGLALLPCLPALRSSPRARGATLAALGVLLATTVASLVQWQQGHAKGAIAAGVAVLAGFAASAWLRARGPWRPGGSPRWRAAVAAGVLAAVVAGGFWEQRHYLQHRYEDTGARLALADALRFSRDLRDARVAIAGVRGVFNQYPFYGTDLSNRVQWLGVEGDEGAWLRIADCERWRAELNRGDYTHVVTTYDPFYPGRLTDTKEALWTRRDPAAKQVLRNGPVSVFELEGELDPAGCAGLPPLSAAELDGDSVNAEPLANQPPGTGPKEG